jgi:hypothetical protein
MAGALPRWIGRGSRPVEGASRCPQENGTTAEHGGLAARVDTIGSVRLWHLPGSDIISP